MIKIYSWNVNGIRAVINKGELQKFIAKHQPDILLLQETKAGRDKIEVDLAGYNEFWNSAVKPGYSGTALFSKTKPLTVTNGLPEVIVKKNKVHGYTYGDPNDEGRVITGEFDKFFVVGVYTINTKDDLSRMPIRQAWDKAFITYCQELEKSKPVIFCGDLNVAHTEDDLARPKENVGKRGFTKEERAGLQALVDHGFVDTFRQFTKGNSHYTWWTHWANARQRNVGWRIDYFLASKSLAPKLKAAEIHADQMGSDHCPVSITLDL